MKRKLFTDDDDDDPLSSNVPPATFSSSRRKRARYGSLERTLAHMTLGNALTTTTSGDADMWPKISPPCPREQETVNVILPSSVEEPDPFPESVDMEVEPTGKSCFLLI